MKNYFLYTAFLLLPFFCVAQKGETGSIVVRGENGTIQSVTLSESDTSYTIPNSLTDFFENWLNVSTNDQFREVSHVSKK